MAACRTTITNPGLRAAEGYYVQSRLACRVGRRVLQRDWRGESGILETSVFGSAVSQRDSSSGAGTSGTRRIAEVCRPRRPPCLSRGQCPQGMPPRALPYPILRGPLQTALRLAPGRAGGPPRPGGREDFEFPIRTLCCLQSASQ